MTANLWARWICCICLPHAKLGLAMSVIAPSRRVLCLFAVAILTSGIAAADTIEVTTPLGAGDGTYNGNDLYIDIENETNGKLNGTWTNTEMYFAGNLNIDLTETGSPTVYTRITMCVELYTDINVNTTYDTTVYQPAAFSAPTGAELEQIAYLLDTFDPIGNTLTNDEAAGLQLAIWKISTDGVVTSADPASWTSGAVQEGPSPNETTQNVFGYATTYLVDAEGHSSNNAYVYYNYESNGTVVQMLEGPGGYKTGPPAITPESSTFILAGVALLTLARMARRRLGSH